MPEGHTVHRLAETFGELFQGTRLRLSSPQGRFAAGAALLDGQVLVAAEAYGKQMFLGFAPAAGVPPEEDLLWLRVHLGLYGAWTFAGDPATDVVHAIGAPRKRVGERERVLAGGVDEDRVTQSEAGRRGVSPMLAGARATGPAAGWEPGEQGQWEPPAPRGAVRVRLESDRACADLTGPTACEVLSTAEARSVQRRLGPDPLREDSDPQRFVDAVVRSRSPIGVLLMNQDVIAGVGNIYRAEALFRAGQDPLAPGVAVPREVVLELWHDLAELMADGVRTGAIVTTRLDHRTGEDAPAELGRRLARQNADSEPGAVAREDSFYVYQRDGRPCRVCRTPVALTLLAARNLFWCPACQR